MSSTKLTRGELAFSRFTVPYAVFGDAAPETLLCVNGAQQSIASWFSVARYFVRRGGFRVVCFDFPGQGEARVEGGCSELTMEEQLEVLDMVRGVLSPAQAINVISASWGNVISAIWASRRPDRVARLMLGSFRMKPNAFLREVVVRGRACVDRGDFEGLATLFIEAFGASLPREKQEQIRIQFAHLPTGHFRQLYNQSRLLEAHACLSEIVDLGAIRARTMVVNGAADPIIDGDDAQVAAAIIPDCQYLLVEGAGHFLHFEKPELLATYYEFFSSDAGPSAASSASSVASGASR